MKIDKNILTRKIIDKTVEVMQSLGFDEDGALAYSDFDIYEDDGRVVVEVRAEMDYGEMDALAYALNPIVQEYDEDAYFDHEGFGIINAYIGEHAVHLEERFKDLDRNLFNRFDEAYELEALYESVRDNLTEAQKRRINEFIEMPELTRDDVEAFIIDIQPEEEVALVNDFDACPSAYVDFDNCDSYLISDIPTKFNCGDIAVCDSPLELIGGITIPAGKTFVIIDTEGVCDCPEIKFNDTYYDLDIANDAARIAKINALEDILADENKDMFFTDIEVPVITERLNESVKTVKSEKKVNLRESLKNRDSRDFNDDNKVVELEALYESLKSGFSDEDVKAIVDYEADEKHDSEDVAKFMKSRLDESLLSDKLIFRTEEAFRLNGFTLDKNIKHENPTWNLFGDTLHWQIVNLNHEFDVTREATDADYARLKEIANPLTDDLHKIEGSVPEEFYYTWNFGVDKEGHVTAGVDLWFRGKERDKDDEESEEKLNENINFSSDEIKANLSDEAFKVWKALEKDGATLTNNAELGILYRDDEGHEENYPKWSDLEDDLLFTGREWKEWDFNPMDESLNESVTEKVKDLANDIEAYVSEKGSNIFLDLVDYDQPNDGDNFIIKFEIDDGDWKHEHLFFKHLVREYLKEHGYVLVADDEEEIGDSGSDNYSAIHSLFIKKDAELNEDFWNPSTEFEKFTDVYQEVSNEQETEFDNWNTWGQEKRDEFATEVCKRFLDKYMNDERIDFNVLFDDLEDNNYHTENRILKKMFSERLG